MCYYGGSDNICILLYYVALVWYEDHLMWLLFVYFSSVALLRIFVTTCVYAYLCLVPSMMRLCVSIFVVSRITMYDYRPPTKWLCCNTIVIVHSIVESAIMLVDALLHCSYNLKTSVYMYAPFPLRSFVSIVHMYMYY